MPKGISYVLASVMLLAVVAAVSLAVSLWSAGFFKSETETSSETQLERLKCMQRASILIDDSSVECDLSGDGVSKKDSINFTLRNVGRLDLWEIRAVVYLSDGSVKSYECLDLASRKKFTKDHPLRQGDTRKVTLNISGDIDSSLEIEKMEVFSVRCPEVKDRVENVAC